MNDARNVRRSPTTSYATIRSRGTVLVTIRTYSIPPTRRFKVCPGATVMHGAHISRSGAKSSQLKPRFLSPSRGSLGRRAVACGFAGGDRVNLRLRARDLAGWRVSFEPSEYEVVQGARPSFPVGCRVDLPQACQGEDDVVWIKSGTDDACLLGGG